LLEGVVVRDDMLEEEEGGSEGRQDASSAAVAAVAAVAAYFLIVMQSGARCLPRETNEATDNEHSKRFRNGQPNNILESTSMYIEQKRLR
jgi:hypothetical protein